MRKTRLHHQTILNLKDSKIMNVHIENLPLPKLIDNLEEIHSYYKDVPDNRLHRYSAILKKQLPNIITFLINQNIPDDAYIEEHYKQGYDDGFNNRPGKTKSNEFYRGYDQGEKFGYRTGHAVGLVEGYEECEEG